MKAYINKFYFLNNKDNLILDFIPQISRRRMSALDKISISVMNEVCSENIENIIYASRFGEIDRLLKIISQYKELNEVSPNVFCASVHNHPVCFFLLNKQKPVVYNALSGFKNTISSGLLSAMISEYNNILFCYADVYKDIFRAFGLNISKIKNDGEEYKINIINSKNKDKDEDVYEDFIEFFKGETNFLKTSLFEIERKA